jgi:hypothetical protein
MTAKKIKLEKTIIELNHIERFINEVFDIDLCKNYFDGKNFKFKFIDDLFKRKSGYSLNLDAKQYFKRRDSQSIIGYNLDDLGINDNSWYKDRTETIITNEKFESYMKNALQKRIEKYIERGFCIQPKKYFILMVLFLAREKNIDNLFYKDVFPLDMFKLIIKICDLHF